MLLSLVWQILSFDMLIYDLRLFFVLNIVSMITFLCTVSGIWLEERPDSSYTDSYFVALVLDTYFILSHVSVALY